MVLALQGGGTEEVGWEREKGKMGRQKKKEREEGEGRREGGREERRERARERGREGCKSDCILLIQWNLFTKTPYKH